MGIAGIDVLAVGRLNSLTDQKGLGSPFRFQFPFKIQMNGDQYLDRFAIAV